MFLIADIVALTVAYWFTDLMVRQGGFDRLLRRLAAHHEVHRLRAAVVATAAIGVVWTWDAVPQGDVLRWLGLGTGLMLAWKAATKDIDPVESKPRFLARFFVLVAAGLTYASPAALLLCLLLLASPFRTWEHHATLPMRVNQALVAFAAAAPLSSLLTAEVALPISLFSSAASFLVFAVVIHISHYFITALAKGFLGPQWYSWVVDNQLHHLAASAYSWGWARFIPWKRWIVVIRCLHSVERPTQLLAFTVELFAPLALLHSGIAIGFCLAWSAFHIGVFLTSGLLFWEWIVANLLVAACLASMPSDVLHSAFGAVPLLVGVCLLVLFPLRHRLWKPMPLGWWDTPFTQRMHWHAHGKSGKVYEIYNDFMCPNERLYGKVHGCFLAPTAVCTYHLGEVWKHDLRDAIRSAGPNQDRLNEVRRRFGVHPVSDELANRHRRYIQAFFHALNSGAPKQVLPTWLRWIKAPGGQCFYWGDVPRYRRQEPVTHITIHYRETYFDGATLRRLLDQQVDEIIVRPCREAVPEPTPKEIDEFLLGFARGRLLELPRLGKGFVGSDDGKPA